MIRISKVIIDSSQILAAMPIVLDGIEWPDELLVMLNYLDLSSLDFTQFIGMACWGGKQVSYYTKATVLLSFMATALFILYVIYKISIVLLFKWWATAPIDDKETFMRTELSDLFDLADYDDSGTLDKEEIETVITKMSNKQVSATVVNAFKKIYVEGKDVKELERPEFIKFLLTMNAAKKKEMADLENQVKKSNAELAILKKKQQSELDPLTTTLNAAKKKEMAGLERQVKNSNAKLATLKKKQQGKLDALTVTLNAASKKAMGEAPGGPTVTETTLSS